MRVLETKVATTGLTMGKKKHRIRKQNRENSQFQSDSSDDSHATGKNCFATTCKWVQMLNILVEDKIRMCELLIK